MKKIWLNAALSIGCAEDQEYSYVDFTTGIMECLREVAPQKILQLCTELDLTSPKLSWDRLVVIDGQFLKDKPLELLLNLQLNDTRNVMIGTVEDEGSILLAMFYDQDKYDFNSPRNFSLEEGFAELSTISSHFPSNLQIIGEEVSELYFYAMNNEEDYQEIRYRIASALGDFYITCPTLRFAEILFTENVDYIRVYQYFYANYFDYTGFEWNGKAYHYTDVTMIFGLPFQLPDVPERQRTVSRQMIEMVTHFAKYGLVFKAERP